MISEIDPRCHLTGLPSVHIIQIMVRLNPLSRLFFVTVALCSLFGYAIGNPSPDSIGDIIQEILGELASLGFLVTHFDLEMTVS